MSGIETTGIELLRTIGIYTFVAMAVCIVLAVILFVFAIRRLHRIDVPAGAGYMETMRYTPLSLVIFIDLLDFGLDVLAAPITWTFLDRYGLKALRGVATVEALLPFTQFIPTMTLSWFGARLLRTDTLSKMDSVLGPSGKGSPVIIDQL